MNFSNFNIKIFHTNDIHGRMLFDKNNESIGISKISYLISKLKSKNKNVLLFDAGDVLHGQTIVNTSKGKSAVKLMNMAGYNYFTPGNHDFNYGFEQLLMLQKDMNFKVLAANVVFLNGKLLFAENDIIKVENKKIGIFGLTTPETAFKTNPKNIKEILFNDPVKIAKEQVKLLKNLNSDIIIALTHLGIDDESIGFRSYDVRDNTEGIDLIIDGHSHSELSKIKQNSNKAIIVSAGAYLENLGSVDISITNNTKKIKAENIPFSNFILTKTDKKVDKLANKIKKKILPLLCKIVGKTKVYLEGKKSAVRTHETNLTKIVTDAVKKKTNAQIVFLNGGGFRASINIGVITMNDVISVLPFGNFIVTKIISGKDIIKMLERGLSKYPAPTGSFPQVAGLNCIFDTNSVANSRVKSVIVENLPIDVNKNYLVATNDFISHGGDGYNMTKNHSEIQKFPQIDEIFAEYIPTISPILGQDETCRISVQNLKN
ncbi:MAG: 5'-nucleotidase C-terminal domain-containing protein [Oscillospiraceae bacterium]|nr:5'-nucleotidase C-terminal domain-containing protein [Oscillospiraceae bacterium]